MSARLALRRVLVLAGLAAAAALAWPGALTAAETKVANAEAIKGKIEKLYNGEIDFENSADRERVFIEVDKILAKDTKNIALKKPDFWVDAVQEGRFAGGKRKLGVKGKVVSEDIEVPGKDDKVTKAKMWYRAGALITATKPCPLLVTILEKGTDPKAYLETTWPADTLNDEIKKNWVMVAIADSDEFPISKDPSLLSRPFREIRERFSTDANRWYLEAVGAACDPVQTGSSQFLAHRLAGLVLRGPMKAVTNKNSALYPTLVVHGATSKEGADVFAEYKKVDEKNNAELVLPDLPAVSAANADVFAWFGTHPRRILPSTYTFVTTITDTEGEPWTGSLNIVSPGKRGVPTTVTVSYLKDKNMVDIQSENLSEFGLYMNDDLLNLDNEIAVFVNGTQIAKRVFERDLRQMLTIADTYGEWGRMFTARLRGVVPAKIVAPPAPPANPDPNAPPAQPPAQPPQNPPTPPAPPPAPPK